MSSPSPSTKASLRSRMGSLIRRSSLIPSRPGSPSHPTRKKSSTSISGRSSISGADAASTRRKSEDQQPPAPADQTTASEQHLDRLKPVTPPPGIPSPIAEADSQSPESPLAVRQEPKEEPSTQAEASEVPPAIISTEDGEPSRFVSDEPEPMNEVAQEQVPSVVEAKPEQGAPVVEAAPAEPSSVAPTSWPDGTPVPVEGLDESSSAGKKELPPVSMLAPPQHDPFADPPSPISYRNSTGGFSVNAKMPEPHLPQAQMVPAPNVEATEENRPLLSGKSNPNYSGTSMPVPVLHDHADNAVSPPSPTFTSTSTTKFLAYGWIPHLLPDGRYYYVQPVFRVTTDIELTKLEKLENVMTYLKNSEWEEDRKIEVHCEMYLWAEKKVIQRKMEETLRMLKVDHHRRFVTLPDGSPNEDEMDKEYLYWIFLESHPAHTIPVLNVHQDAMDLVCWSLSDSLLQTPLQSRQNPGTPFSKAEANHLASLLRSFEEGARNGNTPSISHTRLLSRIFARVLEYRQVTQRPSKPLPSLPSVMPSKTVRSMSRTSRFFRGTFLFVVCLLSLGIPLAFSRRSRFDEEASGFRDTTTPSLMLGASVCLVAAVLLTASVSFLSLPGLDSVPRIAILVASLFASFAMISTVFTIFRLKADLETAAFWLGGNEDLLMISNRTILLSLPIVFLAYAIIAFVVGIVLYTFVTTIHPTSDENSHAGPSPTMLDVGVLTEPGNRWVTLGVIGGIAGVMFATIVVLRN